ncbi:tRNA uridine-5-carboxymethylaminomethyl(34) synthesis enzyme MnmG [Mycoplasma miroungirhinis]|uniref:tRNA uridine 5-carboxymethylaminomethyl modification enzyme MnmG n=1 Tax=Mycoplasma miroungirhinis TaxID=754516 RepID=A0A6M4JGX9_9MOLU|nr:tRNA uridine-5-carboxymethylaminomethyl(34) synthesis enzyme MnmG [Mycoplasma miroungirhinis]QJR44272.1 tRNA uridine-5-carboxymethylaminomethyl(34) synthesis enzyme MnmG [Mycoplasma miroungirhinis]
MENNKFDAIVIGGGHAGIEAVYALAKRNLKVALVTLDQTKLAMMPCNPSIGGSAKGIITREIDELGGVQGLFADKAMIQIKVLNTSKGPAVWSLRAQIDKDEYCKLILEDILKQKNITLIEDLVLELIVENQTIKGIKTEKNDLLYANVVVMTTGVYMNSRILQGETVKQSGPNDQRTDVNLSKNLEKYGFRLQRLKTGTPCRIYTDSIEFSEVEQEALDKNLLSFSSRSGIVLDEQTSCWLTHTTAQTREIVLQNLKRSSMYSGLIVGTGPRYCPSFEDKIVRFKEKISHHIFFEPETKKGDVMYINGLSTSMPIEVQDQMIRTIPGLKNAKVQKYGYAIEYDAINPLDLKRNLETKWIKGFFSAGQPNGTSGYEEAAAQGLVAGINAANYLQNKTPLYLDRSDSYIGVLIDDLVTKGTAEPYRMLTSRAEYRLLLRNDNVDQRMSKYAFENEMISEAEFKKIQNKYSQITQKINEFKNKYVSSTSALGKKYNVEHGISYLKLLARPDVDAKDLIDDDFKYFDELAINVRLHGYIEKQLNQAVKMKRLESLNIPEDIDYFLVENLAHEAKEKLSKIRPTTIGQASRISGINPADIQMLMFYMDQRKSKL